MTPNRSNRRVHSSDLKAQVIGECRRPGASIAAVAISHGLNPNVVRKWLAGQNCKRMGAELAASPPRLAPLQFVPVELTNSEPLVASAALATTATECPSHEPDVRLELEHGGLRLKLQCSARSAPSYASLLRALADTMLTA
jgi:transposase